MSLDWQKLLMEQLGNVVSGYASSHLGESAEASTKAAGLAIPAILGGLINHAGDEHNADRLFNLITGSAVDNNWMQALSSNPGDSSQIGKLLDLGKQWLPMLFGNNSAQVENYLSEHAGVKSSSAGSLMALALPLVMSMFRKHIQQNNLSRNQFFSELNDQRGWLERLMDTKLLSALGIPSAAALFSGLTGWGSRLFGEASAATATTAAPKVEERQHAAPVVAASSSPSWLKWVPIVLLGLLALWMLKTCNKAPEAAPAASAPASAVMASEPVAASVPAAASATSEPAAASSAATAPAADSSSVVFENGVAKFYFATGKSEVAADADKVAADIVKAAKDGKKLAVSGFTDSTGNAAQNAELSKNRAKAVQAFLVAQGVPEAQIELRKPTDTTGASGNAAEGRRVEVSIAE